MNNILGILISMVNNISSIIFDFSNITLSSIEKFINIGILSMPYQVILYISLGIVNIMVVIKSIQYVKYGASREGLEKMLKNIFVLMTICMSQKWIMEFTFSYWNSYLSETQVIDILKQVAFDENNAFITTAIVRATSSLSALIIAISQVLEILSLQLILMLSPVILMGSFFNNKVVDKFIKELYKGVASPIIQTLIMYLTVEGLIPYYINLSTISLPIKSIITLGLIFMSFKISKIIVKTVELVKTTKLNMVKNR